MRFLILFTLLTASEFARLGHAAEVLPNGVRIDEIPASDDRFELIVGYQAGLRSETRGLSGLSSIVGHILASSVPARAIAVARKTHQIIPPHGGQLACLPVKNF